MKDFARSFYKSTAWKATRIAITSARGGLCERCLARGLYKPGEIVHHIVPLSPLNITDPAVTLSWDNLQLLCRDCHAAVHKPERRYTIDDLGRVHVVDDCC